jgi:hypothetical protein
VLSAFPDECTAEPLQVPDELSPPHSDNVSDK